MFLKSVPLRASEERMFKWAENLTAKEPRFQNAVYALHEEGTVLFYFGAFYVRDPEDADFAWIFTEHHGYHVLTIGDFSSGIVELKTIKQIYQTYPTVQHGPAQTIEEER